MGAAGEVLGWRSPTMRRVLAARQGAHPPATPAVTPDHGVASILQSTEIFWLERNKFVICDSAPAIEKSRHQWVQPAGWRLLSRGGLGGKTLLIQTLKPRHIR
jgi:hypothetical protein